MTRTDPDQAVPPTPPTAKPWWRSRTLWFNAVCAALATAEASYGVLQPLLPVPVYALLSVALPVGNALLRVLTTQGLQARGTP